MEASVYWYGSQNAANSVATLYSGFRDNGAWSNPILLPSSNFPVQSGTTSWQVGVNGDTGASDYQTMVTSFTNSSFLSVWGRDNRAALSAAYDGGFETGEWTGNGPSGWTPSSSGGATYSVSNNFVHSGSYSAYLGNNPTGCNTPTEATIAETFTVPTVGTNLNLQFYYSMNCSGAWPPCPDSITYDWFKASLYNFATQTTTTILNTYQADGAWHLSQAATVTPGTQYTLTLTNHDDGCTGDPSYTYVDDVVFSGPATGQTMMATLAQ